MTMDYTDNYLVASDDEGEVLAWRTDHFEASDNSLWNGRPHTAPQPSTIESPNFRRRNNMGLPFKKRHMLNTVESSGQKLMAHRNKQALSRFSTTGNVRSHNLENVNHGRMEIFSENHPPPTRFKAGGPNNESPLKWFDRIVSQELHKRKNNEGTGVKCITEFNNKPTTSRGIPSQVYYGNVKESTKCQFDILDMLQTGHESDLMSVIDKFAKAEAACEFHGAVRAAEYAARNAPADQAEEAAAAGAREFCAEIVDVVNEQFKSGIQPIEVIGYVGVTKPKNAVQNFSES